MAAVWTGTEDALHTTRTHVSQEWHTRQACHASRLPPQPSAAQLLCRPIFPTQTSVSAAFPRSTVCAPAVPTGDLAITRGERAVRSPRACASSPEAATVRRRCNPRSLMHRAPGGGAVAAPLRPDRVSAGAEDRVSCRRARTERFPYVARARCPGARKIQLVFGTKYSEGTLFRVPGIVGNLPGAVFTYYVV